MTSSRKRKLSPDISVDQFDSQYWYAEELKKLCKENGLKNTSILRKDELENQIRYFLKTKRFKSNARNVDGRKKTSTHQNDSAKNLRFETLIVNYTNDKTTKDFIEKEALKIDPKLPKKSGAKYWLNRWREERQEKGKKTTYGDLVKQYVKMRHDKTKFPQIPSTKFNNFVSDFLANNEGTRKQALREWERLKKMKVPKTYSSWKKNV